MQIRHRIPKCPDLNQLRGWEESVCIPEHREKIHRSRKTHQPQSESETAKSSGCLFGCIDSGIRPQPQIQDAYTAYMRKRLITPTRESIATHDEDWLDVERTAVVEVTSEDEDCPVESAFVLGKETRGWRAATPGRQTIRLLFDEPQKLKTISLVFEEDEVARTQEFVLRWSADGGTSFREIVRQQWNFSPPETIREVEKYEVALSNVTVLELIIVPDISGGTARASLKNLRLS